MRKHALLAIFVLALSVQGSAWANPPATAPGSELKFNDIFPRKGFSGKSAQGLVWSHEDRYLAYKWNAYEDKGYDLWIYDTKEGKSKRLTTMDFWADVDR